MASTVVFRPAPIPRGRPAPAPPYRNGTALARPSSRWLAGPIILGAAGAGALTALGPVKALVAVGVLSLVMCVWKWPQLGGYLVIGLTPLMVGTSRGAALPIVRPNEAIALLVGGTLIARGIVRLRSGQLPKLRLDRVELAIVLMAVTNSVLPLLWMTLQQEPITSDDVLYALVIWKLLGLYAIVRASVTTDQQVRRCLWLSVAAGCVVAVLAILQSLGLFGVPGLLDKFYASPTAGIAGLDTRGSSTLGMPAATADLLVINLAVVTGLWTRYGRHRAILLSIAALFVVGALAAAEFSSAIGVAVGIICIAIVTRKPRLLLVFLPALVVGGFALRSVISTRLSGFQSASGLPVSWTSRLQNLQTYFWPQLFSHWNFVLGVRPSARIVVPTQLNGYVWIESGYTWLLWGGGIPLLASFVFFAFVTARRGWQAARGSYGARSVAGMAVFTAIFVITVLMVFDPHLTYRGSADAFFFLLALTPRGHPRDAAGAGHIPELVTGVRS